MMRLSLLPCALLALVVSLGAEPAARAQPVPAPQPSPEGADKADAIFQQGNELYRLKKYVEAEAAFEEALRLKKTHDIAANLGYAEMRQGKLREAAEHLDFAVRTWPPTGKPDKRQYAVERLGIVKKEVATLTIQVGVAGAEVFVDGKTIGTSPLPGAVFVEPGSRTIEAKGSGYADARQVIEAAKGAEQVVTLALIAATAVTEPNPVPPPTGSPTAAGSAATTSSAAVPPVLSSDEATSPGGPHRLVLGLGTVTAVAAFGFGLTLAIVSSVKAGEADDARDTLESKGGSSACTVALLGGECAALHDLRDDAAKTGTAAVWTLIGAGILGGGTAIYALTAPKSSARSGAKDSVNVDPRSSFTMAPIVTARSGGVVVVGSW